MFGHQEEEILGRSLETLMPERYRAGHRAGIARMAATGESRLAGKTVSLFGLTKEGSEFPIELSLGNWKSAGEIWFTAVIRDVSARVREERERTWLVDTVAMVTQAEGVTAALRSALEQICEFTGWAYGEAWIPHPSAMVLERSEAFVLRDVRALGFAEVGADCLFARGEGLPGRVWVSQKAEWVTDVRYDTNFPRAGVARELGVKFGAAFPIVVADRIAAIIEFHSFEAREKDSALAQLVRLVAEQLGAVIGRKQSEDMLQARIVHTAAIIEAQQEIGAIGLDRRQLILAVAERAKELTHGARGSVGLVDGDSVVYLTPSSDGGAPAETVMPLVGSVAENALATNASILSDECDTDPRINRDAARKAGIHSVILVPFNDGAVSRGVLVVTSPKPRAFSAVDLDTVTLLAGVLTAALKRSVEFDAKQSLLLERTNALHALQSSERRFRSIIENSSDIIAIFDATGTVAYTSPANERTLGYAPEERLGRAVFELIHPDDLQAAKAAFQQTMESPGKSVAGEFRYRHKNGSWRTLIVHARNLLGDPAVSGVITNATDVTDERALAEQLTHAQRMEAIGVLAGGVSHDFNNLLTVLQGRTEFLLEATAVTDPRREDVEEIQQAIDRATALTQQLLLFSRKQVVRSEILDLNQVIAKVKRMLERLIPENTSLVVDLAPGIARVLADERQLEQMLINLVVNARDAMPTGGTIRITTGEVDVRRGSPELESGMEPGAYNLISLIDNGTGMDAETRDHAFEPFFTTKDVGSGTGLGLATVYGIVRKAGGSINVESEPGTGATFRILLPQVKGLAKPSRTPVSQKLPSTSGETILLVEDDYAVREVAQRILGRLGYKVLAAVSADAPLTYANAVMNDIDLVITDVVMPGMDGPNLVAKLRERFPNVRILYVSGYTPNDAVTEEVASRTAVFLEKPFNTESLGKAVRLALGLTPG